MAKWIFCGETKTPRRVGNEEAARIVDEGRGRYLGKTEAARMLAALEAKETAHEQADACRHR